MKNGLDLFKDQIYYNELYLKDIINDCHDEALKSSNNNLLHILNNIKLGICVNPDLILDLINPSSCKMLNNNTNIQFTSKFIDETQGLAVKKALSMDNLLAIQGPPGAGKTTTITEIIKQLINREKNLKILVTSQSHIAVDNVINKLINDGFKNDVARVRFTDKTDQTLRTYDVPAILDDILKNQDKFTKKIFKTQLEDDKTLEDKYIDFYRNDLMLSKKIIGVTINSISSCRFGIDGNIDYAIIDEVGKCNFAELMMVAQMCKKLIIIGDPKQLPAVLTQFSKSFNYNEEAYSYVEDNNFVNYVFENINSNCKVFLNKQYRMSDAIGTYISSQFYDNLLLNGSGKNNIYIENALNFIDYNTKGYEVITSHKKENDSSPLYNLREIEIIKFLLDNELKDYPRDKIALIAPYKEQRKRLREEFKDFKENDISTVDAFQGREADIVIFSCVRNYGRVTDYFKKENRLNVAISRSIKKIYIVGSEFYASKVDYLRNFIDFNCQIKSKDGIHNCQCNRLFYNGIKITKNKRSRLF